jgi:hypothetical protein
VSEGPRRQAASSDQIILCYEAGYDAFWLARFLKARGVDCLVIDSASMQVNRRSRRAKTDRIDVVATCNHIGERHDPEFVRPSILLLLIALYENATPFVLKMLGAETPDNFGALKQLWPLGKFPLLDDNGA